MNLSFPSVEIARPFATPLGFDFQRLVATCAALQAGSPTAAAEARLSGVHEVPVRPVDALVTLLGGRTGWAGAVAVLQGSFNPEAARHVSHKLL